MNLLKLLRYQIQLCLAVTAIVIGLSQFKLQAQLANNPSENLRIIYEHPPVPADPPPPGRSEGAGSNNLCEIDKPPNLVALIALVPTDIADNNGRKIEYVWGKTTAAHPTFWFYAAYTTNAYGQLTVYNQEFDEVARIQQQLNIDKPGLVSFSLRENKISLEPDRIYHWEFTIYCNEIQGSPNDRVAGSVQRVSRSPNFQDRLETATPLEQVKLYAENSIWYDALTILAELRRENPQDETLTVAWEQLLNSIDRDDELKLKPILPCCQSN